MNVLYIASSGSSDTTRASIPLHRAVNGSIEIGHQVGVVLAGDATDFLKPQLLEAAEGAGLPPLRARCSPRLGRTPSRCMSERAAPSPVGRPRTSSPASAASGSARRMWPG